ncbi:MAG: MBL fold metallo-hydrolase [Infirmifilum sp.]
MHGGPSHGVALKILYDNDRVDERLFSSHGFAALLRVGETGILFDTGGNPGVLLYNMGVLGVSPNSISTVVISHNHWDHTGGLSALLSINPALKVVMPGTTSPNFPPGVRLVGPFEARYKDTLILEQALAVETGRGVVLLVGCSHPGVDKLVEAAKNLGEGKVSAVVGGFHLVESRDEEVVATARRLLELGVEELVPCHCTGRRATEILRAVHGRIRSCGVGASYTFG